MPYAWQRASAALKDDHEVIKTAVRLMPYSLQHASAALKDDLGVVKKGGEADAICVAARKCYLEG